jgi:hypothetical protein
VLVERRKRTLYQRQEQGLDGPDPGVGGEKKTYPLPTPRAGIGWAGPWRWWREENIPFTNAKSRDWIGRTLREETAPPPKQVTNGTRQRTPDLQRTSLNSQCPSLRPTFGTFYRNTFMSSCPRHSWWYYPSL